MGLEVDCFKFDLKRKKSRSEMIPARKLVLFVRKLNKNVVVIIVNNDSNTLQGHFEMRVEELKRGREEERKRGREEERKRGRVEELKS